MKYIKFVILASILIHCSGKMVEQMIAVKGSTIINLDNAKLVIPEGCGLESTLVSFEQRSVPSRSFFGGYRMTGQAFVIKPDSLLFTQPIRFSYPVGSQANVKLAVRIAHGFVPLAGSGVVGETLQADIDHGGEYYIIETPAVYGILNAGQTDSALLIIPDMYVGNYVGDFSQTLNGIDYGHPVWLFTYPPENSIDQNACLLSENLKELHERFGKFRLDVVGFGVGGLITHRYVMDTLLYHYDVSPAILAVGTPFFGSSLTSRPDIVKSTSPYRFYLLDGLGDNMTDLTPNSAFIAWIKDNRSLPGWQSESLEENKNFASIRGVMGSDGSYPEEYEGDGVVSLASAMLTAIEPDPFRADHFGLFENKKIQTVIGEFIKLYRGYNWPLLFTRVCRGDAPMSLINETWAREAMLNFRDKRNFDILLEWNKNLLNSVPSDAILITNGDNDTYPAWYLQAQGVRTDVTVANLSLLNIGDYRRYLVKHGLPLEMDSVTLDTLKPYRDEKTKVIVIPADIVIRELLGQKQRPLVFSTTVYDPYKYNQPLKICGLVYEIGTGDACINMPQCSVSIDIDRTKELLHHVFSYDKLFKTPGSAVSPQIQGLVKNYASVAFQQAVALGAAGEKEAAINEIAFAKKFSASPVFLYNEAMSYFQIKMTEKADSILQYLLAMEGIDIATRKNIARIYHENGLNDKAVIILAQCLKENPVDKEITELIKKYQEE
jgi:tetratricopeptide (TPR) repeat protein